MLLGLGDGAFAPQVTYPSGSNSYSLTTADFNEDGITDLAVANISDDLLVLLGFGDGTFAPPQSFGIDSPRSVTTADFNADSLMDLATANFENVSVLLNECGPVLLGDVNRDGFVDLLDISPFVDLVSDGEFQTEADVNQDGVVDLLDIQPFVDILTGG